MDRRIFESVFMLNAAIRPSTVRLAYFALVGSLMMLQARGQVTQTPDLTLAQAMLQAQSTWMPLKADTLMVQAAQRDAKAHPMLEPAQLNSEWGQINSVYRDQGLQINQVFRLPGVYKTQRTIAHIRLEGAKIENERTLASLTCDLVKTYYQFLVLNRKIKLLQYNDSLLTETVKILRIRHLKGQISTSELNQILLIQGESSINLQSAKQESTKTLGWFQFLTGSTSTPKITDSIIWTEGLNNLRPTLVNPDLKWLANQSNEAMATSHLSRQSRYPGWSLGLRNMSIQGMAPDGNLYPLSRRFNALQMGLVFPLWGKSLREQAQASRLRSEAMSTTYRHGIAQLEIQQNQSLLEILSLQNQWAQFTQTLIPLTNDLTRQANAQLATGELDLIQWTHTLQRIMQTNESRLQLALNLNHALIRHHYPDLIP